jgi:hypothetical protein
VTWIHFGGCQTVTPEQLAIVVALIGASAGVFGLVGVLAGSRIAANATLGAAKVTQQEAQADREEARRLHFDGRLRELAAEVISGEAKYLMLIARRRYIDGPLPDLEVDEGFRRSAVELELLVRMSATLTALQGVHNASYVIYDYDYQVHGPEEDTARVGRFPDDLAEWTHRYDKHEEAVARFKVAMRAEIGLDELEIIEPPEAI